MELESYFEFRGPDEIRVRGTRVGIEVVLAEYRIGRTAEEIALNYPALSPEQVHACITYYLHNRPAIDQYLARWREFGVRERSAQEAKLPELLVRLREMARQRRAHMAAGTGNPG
jgi:uncharacterized protein (DUF433 family)